MTLSQDNSIIKHLILKYEFHIHSVQLLTRIIRIKNDKNNQPKRVFDQRTLTNFVVLQIGSIYRLLEIKTSKSVLCNKDKRINAG